MLIVWLTRSLKMVDMRLRYTHGLDDYRVDLLYHRVDLGVAVFLPQRF